MVVTTMISIKRIETLAIGDELLDGRVTDTNTSRLAQALREVGLQIAQRSTVVDDINVIIRTAQEIVARGTQLCVVSGGLGPTGDDLTREALAQWAGVPLERDAQWVARLEQRFAERGYELTENQKKQADYPRGAQVIPNPTGTAPGFAIEVQGCRFVCVPGVPREYDHMVEQAVLKPLRGQGTNYRRFELRTFGLIEGEVDRRVGPLLEKFPGVSVGYRAAFPEIHVTVRGQAGSTLDQAVAFAREALGRNRFTEREQGMAQVVLEHLRERGWTVATAESCTGGLVGDRLTDVPGSSDVFLGGVIAYSNAIKRAQLGVPEQVLQEQGAVSEATVKAMALGVRSALHAHVGIAVSGVAGPGGGTPDKPVGTVWIAAALPHGDTVAVHTRLLNLPFDRRRNKVVAAHSALDLVRRLLDGASD